METNTPAPVRLPKLVDKALGYIENRLLAYCSELMEKCVDLSDEKSLMMYTNKFKYLEDYLMQTYRNKSAETAERTLIEIMGLTSESSASRELFRLQRVLTKCQTEFIQEVNLDGTDIIDRMVVDSIMTEDERESIVQEKTPRRRKEAFLTLV